MCTSQTSFGSKVKKSKKPLPTVLRARLDDSDEHIGSKELRLSEPGDFPSNTPMSADVNLSSLVPLVRGLGQFPAVWGSLRQGDRAGSVRFSRSASSCSPHASDSGLSSERAKPEAFFFAFFSSQSGLVDRLDLSQCATTCCKQVE